MITVTIGPDGSGSFADESGVEPVTASTEGEVRRLLLGRAVIRARAEGQPVRVTAVDASGHTELLVSPDGSLSAASRGRAAHSHSRSTSPTPELGPVHDDVSSHSSSGSIATTVVHDATQQSLATQYRKYSVNSFLASNAVRGPQPKGWRSWVGRMGIKVGASEAERQQWLDERAAAQHWPGPRTIAVLNGKGGAGKTPTAILLAGYFARLGSGSVVAAGGNVTRGTLAWRTEQGAHGATILDLVPEIDRLMDPAARNGDVATFTHHQTIDQFDALRSNPLLLSTEQKLTPEQLDGVQRVLTRYYRMIVWDTGNDEGDSLWLQIVSHADQIVIATTTRADHAEAGRLLLKGLASRDERGAALVSNAVVVVSQADKEEVKAQSLVAGFEAAAREVVTVPYDAAMREQWLRSDKLAAPTRAAWLHAAAAVARGL